MLAQIPGGAMGLDQLVARPDTPRLDLSADVAAVRFHFLR